MAQVAALIKVFPEDMKFYDSIKEEIRKMPNVGRIDEEPVAFGFKCLKVVVLLEDGAQSEDIEEKFKKIPGVSEAQVEEVGRI